MGNIQHLWTLCVIQLKVAEQLFAFSVMLELDDDKDFLMMMFMHHCMHTIDFCQHLTIIQWKLPLIR